MLSGIKTGKRKRVAKDGGNKEASVPPASCTLGSNQSVADQLRQSGMHVTTDGSAIISKLESGATLPHELLERSGRISKATKFHPSRAEVPAAGGNDDQSAATQLQEDNVGKQRELSRQIAGSDQHDQAVARCWWWLESHKFAKHRLLSLGNHVSLVMAPSNLSLSPGHHFYLVPIKHAESLAGCEEEVWDEIVRFQTALRLLFEKEYQKGLLFSETVTPSKNFNQTKMEVIPVEQKVWQDLELYFKSTLAEQADDFGTHNKPLSTHGKGLRKTIPKGFPYVYVEWDAPNQGVAQLIESPTFPQYFVADTVAGITGADPIRFRSKKKVSLESERQLVLDFVDKWKKYDWTDQLDI